MAMGRSKLGPSFFTSAGARLIVVRPITYLKPLFSIAVLTRSRDSFTAASGKPTMMTPNAVYEVPVDLHATSWYLPPGHRLRVDVSSSNFPRYDRNLNTGGRNFDETTWRVAKNAVHHTAAHMSRLILPVISPRAP